MKKRSFIGICLPFVIMKRDRGKTVLLAHFVAEVAEVADRPYANATNLKSSFLRSENEI